MRPATRDRKKQAPVYADADISAIAAQGRSAVRCWVEQTAAQRGVRAKRTGLIRFAEAASRLSDADAQLDETEQMMVALTRAGVLTSFQRGLLQVRYLF